MSNLKFTFYLVTVSKDHWVYTVPADDIVRVVILLGSDDPATCLPTVHSDVFVLRVWCQVQPSFPLLVLVWLEPLHEAVHADAHHVASAHALCMQRHTPHVKLIHTAVIRKDSYMPQTSAHFLY